MPFRAMPVQPQRLRAGFYANTYPHFNTRPDACAYAHLNSFTNASAHSNANHFANNCADSLAHKPVAAMLARFGLPSTRYVRERRMHSR